MAKKSTKVIAPYIEPEEESQEPPDPEFEPKTPPPTKTISKVEAVRRALEGGFESPDSGTDYIRDAFGIEVTKQHFSATKSQLKSKAGAVPKAKPGRKPRATSDFTAPPPPIEDGSELLDAMEAMKPLVASLGKEQVKRIVDLLG